MFCLFYDNLVLPVNTLLENLDGALFLIILSILQLNTIEFVGFVIVLFIF
jgi:hypothetical protein